MHQLEWLNDELLLVRMNPVERWNEVTEIQQHIHQEVDTARGKVHIIVDLSEVRSIPKTNGLDLVVMAMRNPHPKVGMTVLVAPNRAIRQVASGMARLARATNRIAFTKTLNEAFELMKKPLPVNPDGGDLTDTPPPLEH